MENDSLQPSEIRRDMQVDDTQKHRESLRRKPVSGEMGAAIQRLIPGGITRSALLDLFDQRASHKAIEAWRYGWRGAPQWAVDLIRSKLAARAAADIAAGAMIPVSRGMGWNKGAKTLAVWRERKARERDEKEKAAHEAALRNGE